MKAGVLSMAVLAMAMGMILASESLATENVPVTVVSSEGKDYFAVHDRVGWGQRKVFLQVTKGKRAKITDIILSYPVAYGVGGGSLLVGGQELCTFELLPGALQSINLISGLFTKPGPTTVEVISRNQGCDMTITGYFIPAR
jgi:hypothetical protein